MKEKNSPWGLLAALLTITIWSTTYISTKILIQHYTALQISAIRFTLGLLFLLILAPPMKKKLRWREEGWFVLTGVTGIFLYYFLENLASQYTYASNISVIVSTIPLLTSITAPLLFKEERFRWSHLLSFTLWCFGFWLLVRRSGSLQGISPLGDLLALGAAGVFTLYTLLLRRVSRMDTPLRITRKTMFYGWLVTMASCTAKGDLWKIGGIGKLSHLPHFLFLGLLASGLCFITWTFAIKKNGPVLSSQFIYLVPVITVTLSALLLKEPVGKSSLFGMAFILTGVIISQVKKRKDN